MPRLRLARLAPFALLAVAVPAHAAIGEWVEGEHVRLRLVATHDESGALQGLIEMELEPGWKTYWRSPGDAGIPPRFDFSASRNAGGAEVEFPAPERSDDGFAASNVYHDRVALPVRFAPPTAGQPVRLDLAADLGVCDEVCLPVAIKAVLDVPAADRDNAADGMIREARAALPGPGRPGEFEILALKRVDGDDRAPVFEAEVHAGSADDVLLFAETPADWYPAPPAAADEEEEGVTRFRFAVDRKSATTPIDGAEIRLTLTEGDAATERRFHLDATGAGH